MRQLNIKRRIRDICIICLVIFMLLTTIMNTSVLAAGAMDSDPGVDLNGGSTTGTNITSISDAISQGVSVDAIKAQIKEATGKNDAEVNKIYSAATQDTTKIQVKFTKQGTTGNIVLNDVIVKFTDDEIQSIMDGTYSPNLGTQQDPVHNQSEKNGLEGENQGDIGGVLFGPIAWLLQGIGDVGNNMIQRLLTGDKSSVFYSTGWLGLDDSDVKEAVNRNPTVGDLPNVNVVKDYVKSLFGSYGVPEIRITPAEIFAGNVAALDANFFATDEDVSEKLGGEEHSIVVALKPFIARWYVALRNIAIVGLLSVLLYIGIRIIISSSAGDKAKYKQIFIDWVVALCLIFFMHYIMAFTMTMSETVTDVLKDPANSQTKGTIKQVNIVFTNTSGSPDGMSFSSNFTGVARLKADYQDSVLKMGYSILYVGLTIYTVYFAIVYLKRLLMLAFFTMIAPLVALTYPLDKIKDGKAQAFNYWFKEYMFYALLQPMHMVLYTVLVSSAISIAADNLLYAIVALAFIVPAEKILKQMFGIKGQTESSIAGFAGGALAAQAFNSLKHLGQGKGSQTGGVKQTPGIRTASNPNSPDEMTTLANNAMELNGLPSTAGVNATADTLAAGTAGAIGGAVAASSVDRNDTTAEEPVAQLPNDMQTGPNMPLEGMQAGSTNPSQANTRGNSPQIQASGIRTKLDDNKGNKFKAYKQQLANNFKKAVNKRYVAAGGWKGIAKDAAVGLGKGYIKAAGAIAGASLGAGIGVVGGDLEDVAKGGAAGLVAGAYTGGRANKAISNAGNSSVGRFVGEVRYGDDYQKQQFIKEYMGNAEYKQKIMDKNPNISADELEKTQKAQAEMAYDAKLTSYSDIKGAVKLEKALEKQGVENAHGMAVATAKMAKNYDNSTFTDQKKFENAQKQLQKKLEKQINEQIEERYKGNSAEINKRKAKSAAQADEQARKVLENISKIKGI